MCLCHKHPLSLTAPSRLCSAVPVGFLQAPARFLVLEGRQAPGMQLTLPHTGKPERTRAPVLRLPCALKTTWFSTPSVVKVTKDVLSVHVLKNHVYF